MQNCENTKLSPAPSARMTGAMSRLKPASCGFVATISGSFHFLIAPVKILHDVPAGELQVVDAAGRTPSIRLYMNASPPALTGTYTKHPASAGRPPQRRDWSWRDLAWLER